MKQSKSSQSSHPLVAFSILIILAGLISADIYLYVKSQKETPVPQPTTTTSDDMSNWQTYANYDLGFQINYPANRLPIEIHPDNTTEHIVFGEIIHGPFTIDVKRNTTIDEYIAQDFKDNPSCANRKTIKLNNYGAVFYTCENEFAGGTIDIFTIAKNNNIYAINFMLVPQGTTAENVRFVISPTDQKMLDSFRFTDDINDWQTYTNTDYGFSLQYPKDWHIWYEGAEEEMYLTIGDYPSESPHINSFSLRIQIDTDLESYDMKRVNPSLRCTDKQDVNINNYHAISYKCASSISPESFERYLLSASGSTFDVSVAISPNKNAIVYKKILSTFRFTDDMSDWQTYRSENGQFEFEYPSIVTVKKADAVGHFPQLDGQSFQQYWNGVYIDYTNNYTNNPSGEDISLSIWPTNISADEFQRLYNSDGDPYSSIAGKKNITFAGHPAILIVADTAIGVPRNYIFPKAIPIVIEYYEGTTTKKILSTFKFIK